MKCIRSFLVALALVLAPAVAFAQAAPVQQSPQDLQAAVLSATATGAANTAVTATIPAVTGSCLYITYIYISEVANAAVTAAAGPAPIFTTTGLSNNLVWWGNNATLGTGAFQLVTDQPYTRPIKVAQSTAFTIVTSGGQSTQSVRINVLGYAAGC
jgi:hypothetical protein